MVASAAVAAPLLIILLPCEPAFTVFKIKHEVVRHETAVASMNLILASRNAQILGTVQH